jgi:hypothetical protein
MRVPSLPCAQVVTTNLLGTLLCSRKALSIFGKQPGGFGHLFNMDGAGEARAVDHLHWIIC